MNWDAITALAAVVGTVALVASLLYVGRQIREATRQRRVEAYHSVLADVDDFSKLLARDQETSDIWWRASKGIENLTDAQRVRYFALLYILFRSWEKAFHHGAEEVPEDWTTEVMTTTMVDFAMSNGVQEYWALRKRWYTAEFRSWVDAKMKERSGVDVYGEEFRIFGTAEEESDA